MDNIKNLTQAEGIAKLKELGEGVDVCMFCTGLGKAPFQTRPMSTQQVDEQGNFWFLSDRQSDKNNEINHDEQVQLLYASVPDNHYLNVYGKAFVYRDRAKIEELWKPMVSAWFEKDDPNITVIRVQPEHAYYWDTKYGKFIALLGIAASMLTGKTMDNSQEGTIKP